MIWLALVLAVLALVFEAVGLIRQRQWRMLPRAAVAYLGLPAIPVVATLVLPLAQMPDAVQIFVTIGLVLPIAPLLYGLRSSQLPKRLFWCC